jgi:predicted nucleotide-binding protein
LVYTANQDPAIVDIIEQDEHAKYLSRWSSPKFKDFIRIVHKMLGVELQELPLQSFIVHGHDDKTKLEVKNYLQNRLHLPEPIILHEQPSLGRTLIEKFEDLSAKADLAFVLLTPDDLLARPENSDVQKRRARQNVILELGFFLGMLGRRSGRVFLMYKGPLELPSDLSGIIYLNIDGGIEAVGEQIRLEIEAVKKMWFE